MDEIPITGEPGAFHLSGTGRKEKDKPSVLTVGKGVPPPLKMDTNIGDKEKGKEGAEKTPTATKSPGSKGPKRKKSKANISTGGVSPT